jgi:hypothetical protein
VALGLDSLPLCFLAYQYSRPSPPLACGLPVSAVQPLGGVVMVAPDPLIRIGSVISLPVCVPAGIVNDGLDVDVLVSVPVAAGVGAAIRQAEY